MKKRAICLLLLIGLLGVTACAAQESFAVREVFLSGTIDDFCRKQDDETVSILSETPEKIAERANVEDCFNLRLIYTSAMDSIPPELYHIYGISKADDWKSAYLAYLDADVWGIGDRCTYSFLYVNDDDIPEMVVDTGGEAGGCQIVTYNENVNGGTIEVLLTCRRMFDYMEKDGILHNYGGNTGSYFDFIYELGDNGWSYVTGGEFWENYDDLRYDEEGNVVDIGYLYRWEGKDVSKEQYETLLQAAYAYENAVKPSQNYYILSEMHSILENGKVSTTEHRYKLIVEDISWEEAYDACREKGGYLATAVSVDEFERIQEQIVKEGKTDISFWVGANSISVEGKYYFGYHWLEPGVEYGYDMLHFYKALWSGFWFEGEPGYRMETESGETISEDYVMISYYEDHGRCYLSDTVNDILSIAPSYAGKIGYICEYDE